MKLCKRILSLILVIVMMGSLSACQAAEVPTSSETPAGDSALLSSAPNHAESLVYSDVPADADYAEAVAWCYENGLMAGTSTTTFDPEGTLTRAMLATVLYRAEKNLR